MDNTPSIHLNVTHFRDAIATVLKETELWTKNNHTQRPVDKGTSVSHNTPSSSLDLLTGIRDKVTPKVLKQLRPPELVDQIKPTEVGYMFTRGLDMVDCLMTNSLDSCEHIEHIAHEYGGRPYYCHLVTVVTHRHLNRWSICNHIEEEFVTDNVGQLGPITAQHTSVSPYYSRYWNIFN